MTIYAVAFPHVLSRPHIDDGNGFMGMVEIIGEEAKVEWVPNLKIGIFERNVDAKRALLEHMREIKLNSEYSDDHIRAMFRYFTNTQTAKIVKVSLCSACQGNRQILVNSKWKDCFLCEGTGIER